MTKLPHFVSQKAAISSFSKLPAFTSYHALPSKARAKSTTLKNIRVIMKNPLKNNPTDNAKNDKISRINHSTKRQFTAQGKSFNSVDFFNNEPRAEKFLDTIKYGAPKIDPNKPCRVIVVGAGMAGLCASRELLRAGYEVKLLERTQRASGRVYTVRKPFSDGLYAEAGAMRIPAAHFLVWAYLTTFNIPTNRFQNSAPNEVYYFEEPDIPQERTFKSDKDSFNRLISYWSSCHNVTMESLPISKKFDETMNNLEAEIENYGFETIVRKYDNMTLETFLKCFGWSDNEIFLYSITSTEESIMGTAGAVENIPDFITRVWDDSATATNPIDGTRIVGLHEITGGMDKLGDAFLEADNGLNKKKVKDIITYGAKVVSLKTQPDQNGLVTVQYEDLNGKCHNEQAHYIIMAVPSLVLRNIDIRPPFSISKQKAIREIQYAPGGKIFLQYRHRWWRDPSYKVNNIAVNAPEEGGAGAFTTLGIRQIYFPPDAHSKYDDNKTERGVVIVSYTCEQDTLNWGSLPEQEVTKLAAQQVEKIFPGTLELLEVGHSVMWHKVDWTGGGAFAYSRPGQSTRLFNDIIAPDGIPNDKRIIFAGEQCSPIHYWIQGALDSALRAVYLLRKLQEEKAKNNLCE